MGGDGRGRRSRCGRENCDSPGVMNVGGSVGWVAIGGGGRECGLGGNRWRWAGGGRVISGGE